MGGRAGVGVCVGRTRQKKQIPLDPTRRDIEFETDITLSGALKQSFLAPSLSLPPFFARSLLSCPSASYFTPVSPFCPFDISAS